MFSLILALAALFAGSANATNNSIKLDTSSPRALKVVQQPKPDFDREVITPLRQKQAEDAKIAAEKKAAESKPAAPVIPISAPPVVVQPPSTLAKWLLDLRTCEAGGNYQTNTGNGYYGAYQFSLQTWASLNTGFVRPDLAPPAVQDQAIIANTKRSGGGLATQNPGCYSKMGLSAFPPA